MRLINTDRCVHDAAGGGAASSTGLDGSLREHVQCVDDLVAIRTWLQAAVSSVAPEARKQKRTSGLRHEQNIPTSRFWARPVLKGST